MESEMRLYWVRLNVHQAQYAATVGQEVEEAMNCRAFFYSFTPWSIIEQHPAALGMMNCKDALLSGDPPSSLCPYIGNCFSPPPL